MSNIKIQTPASHREDPETSYIAEDGMNKSGKRFTHQQQITAYVTAHPNRTAAEIGHATGLGQFECSRRLSEINGVTVYRANPRRCSIRHTKMMAWYPMEHRGQLELIP